MSGAGIPGRASNNSQTLRELLQNKEKIKDFKYFLSLEFGEENLAFYFEVEEYNKTLSIQDAYRIVEEYIKVDSKKELNISSQARFTLLKKMESLQWSSQQHQQQQQHQQVVIVVDPTTDVKEEQPRSKPRWGFGSNNNNNNGSSSSSKKREDSSLTALQIECLPILIGLFHEAQEEVFNILFMGPYQRYRISTTHPNAAIVPEGLTTGTCCC